MDNLDDNYDEIICEATFDCIFCNNLYINSDILLDDIKILEKELNSYDKLRIDFYFNREIYYDKIMIQIVKKH